MFLLVIILIDKLLVIFGKSIFINWSILDNNVVKELLNYYVETLDYSLPLGMIG